MGVIHSTGIKLPLYLLKTQKEGDKIFFLHNCMHLCAGRISGKTHPLLSSKFPMDGAKPHLRVHIVGRKVVPFILGSTHLTFLAFFSLQSLQHFPQSRPDLSHLLVARLS